MNEQKYIVDVQEKDGESFIELPDELIESTGWKEGDRIHWKDNGDGSFSLSKKQSVWVMVDELVTYRARYMIEAPADHPEYALDTVATEEAPEFSQKYLGSQIIDHRVVTEDEALEICDKENDYAQVWSRDKKMEVFFTTMQQQGYNQGDE